MVDPQSCINDEIAISTFEESQEYVEYYTDENNKFWLAFGTFDVVADQGEEFFQSYHFFLLI